MKMFSGDNHGRKWPPRHLGWGERGEHGGGNEVQAAVNENG